MFSQLYKILLVSGICMLFQLVSAQNPVSEIPLDWPTVYKGSTHELIMNEEAIYVTGQNMHHVAKSHL